MHNTYLAKDYRLPQTSTPEKLEMSGLTTISYGIHTIAIGYYYSPDGDSYYAAIYTFKNGRSCEDECELGWITPERYEDDGHAIKRALEAL